MTHPIVTGLSGVFFQIVTVTVLVGTERPAVAGVPVPRADAFFGLHFDLHPRQNDKTLGADVSEANIDMLLRRVRPDYVQYDCKGHAGYLGYPSEVGPSAPGIVNDSLAYWRKVTQARGVGLFIHFSGLWDSEAVRRHPEWAAVDADGKPSKTATSVFGPYVDRRMIPQLKEVTAKYALDGLWVDGECWAAKLDYSAAALATWKQETGHATAPKKRDEPNWHEWKTFHREHFERYVGHWVDAMHAFNPKLQITSNWLYTTFMPKRIVAKVDFLSGDYAPSKSVDQARVEARYLANTGMPWDLMAWGFVRGHAGMGHNLKTAAHLQQEASVVLMQGGGFQMYNQPTRSGHIPESMIETLGQVADFCRVRQAVSHKSASVPQVAVVMSTRSMLDRGDAVGATYGTFEDLKGTLHALLELHYSVDVLAEHQLRGRVQDFPMVVVPDFERMDDALHDELLAYVKAGGRLLLMGARCAKLFEPVLGVTFEGPPKSVRAELATSAGIVNVNGAWQKVVPKGADVVAFRYPTRNIHKDREPAATVVPVEEGWIGAVYGPVGLRFLNLHHPYLRQFMGDLARRLFPDPAVVVDGPPCLDVALRRARDGRLCVHLLNRANMPTSNDYGIIDHVPPVGPFRVCVRVPDKPDRVTWIPGDIPLESSWLDGWLSVTVPQVRIHGALVVQP